MLKKVRIQIETERRAAGGSLFAPTDELTSARETETERISLTVQGRWHDDGARMSLSYRETELTGLEGSTTSISYQKSDPLVISMLRTGTVRTALLFEEGKHHLSVYETPIMPFEVCVFTRKIRNGLEREGTLTLDYDIELRGADAEHTHFVLRVLPDFDKPQKKA